MNEAMDVITNAKKTLGDAKMMTHVLIGEQRQARTQKADLEKNTGIINGRVMLKPQIDDFLQRLQDDVNKRAVGGYETMLTAIAQEVLPEDNMSIKLDLHVENNAPALDFMVSVNENAVDIIDDAGGSLTNVIGLGLRTIAIVKSGLRPFLAMDEGDCWLKPERVPAFNQVIAKLSSGLGFQALIISHHDIELFPDSINIIEMTGKPQTGVIATAHGNSTIWKDDEKGIRRIVARNFAAYKDIVFDLAPGVNAIIGDNNIGKSRVMKLLRAIAYGETSDRDIRHGQKRTEAEIHLENGMVLHWSREIRRNPVCLWTLKDQNGVVMSIDGEICESGLSKKRQAPDWVPKILGIDNLDGLDMQIGRQKFPVFLLDRPPSQRASVLSVGQESTLLREMILRHRTVSAEDKATLKRIEDDLRKNEANLHRLEPVGEIANTLEKLNASLESIEIAFRKINDLETLIKTIGVTQEKLNSLKRKQQALAALPNTLLDISRRQSDIKDLSSIIGAIETASEANNKRRRYRSVLAALPSQTPIIKPVRPLNDVIASLGNLLTRRSACQQKRDALMKTPTAAPSLHSPGALDTLAKTIETTRVQLARLKKRMAALDTLPTPPVFLHPMSEINTLREVAVAIMETASRLRKLNETMIELKQKEVQCALDFTETFMAAGGRCPTCGGAVSDDHVHNVLAAGFIETGAMK